MQATDHFVNTKWTACQRKLLKDGRNFFVRGVNYAPTPIGKPGRLDMLGEPSIFLRDLQNLRLMNANAVKTYDFYSTVQHQEYLDAAFNSNVDPIYTIFSIWIDQGIMDPSLSESSTQFQHLAQEYYRMAKQTGGHPGVMGYSIGGEMNSITVIHDKSFWKKFHALTNATDYPGSVIPRFLAVPGDKPLLVSEYGYPYASNKGIGDTMQLNYVADLLTQQTLAMQNNFQQMDGDEQAIVGGFVFEYSDEWWKAGNPDEHNLGLVKNGQFPLGYLSEEYFGLFSVTRATDEDRDKETKNLPNVLRARPTVSLLTKIWGNGPLNSEGDLIEHCNSNTAPLQNTGTNSVVDSSQNLPFDIFMMLGLLGGVFFLLLAVYRTYARRMKYQKLSSTGTAWCSPQHQAPTTVETSLLSHNLNDHQVV
ncbi:hypothetical protein BBO99_00005787 [Phytophthora kernoviae]|uniref:Glycoside hydrolase family 2 catalytic domain-containing protein n=2 Tax=Phytophthora kernoviae TaxID=325452 RepID=A0A3R7KIK8_9STRA|nr:hypothetical protein G195_006420 [Phytophthora kernoviae 00238/432]KAG2516507.1 hypothetical protein JM16_005500 [Phytophthora kernoviae]KAG2524900.1 hypothetical protein JM18_005181 [Phytophthora kernoviae]RLN36565.1 hypothetical protein BBI17_005818 [Phytophthora kernoviae]RLN78706.1 hypothetical protein BBO99_00005787 [Phytophthora kernoviae]